MDDNPKLVDQIRQKIRWKQYLIPAGAVYFRWPVVACRDRQQWSFSASMPVKSNANDWSGRMQVGGQVCAITQLVVDGKFHFGSVTALQEVELAEKCVSRGIKII